MSDATFTTPPPTSAGAPVMSTPETLANIFFEPAETFSALRERPRFLVAGLIILALALIVTALLMQKVNFSEFMIAQMEKNPQAAQMTPEQKEQAIGFWTGPIGKVMTYVMPVVGTVVIFAAGAGLYMLAVMLMGGKLSYKQALSVWVYSSFPPAILGGILAAVILFLKPAEEIDLNKSGAGLAVTNLGALINPASNVLRAALSWFDLFTFFGMFLAAVGLRKVGKISSGSAWTIVIAMWFIGLVFSVARAALFGR